MALSANRDTRMMGEHPKPMFLSIPVTDNVHIYSGALVGLDSAGRARPMTVSATTPYAVGRAEHEADNTVVGHSAGGINVLVRMGVFKFTNDTGTALTAASRGAVCYAKDDFTVSGDSTSRAIAGTVISVDSDGVFVMVGLSSYSGSDATVFAASLASVANGSGAALVAIEDAAALLSAATVEAAILELAKYEAIALADPGTGVAVPVTRSATVDFTIGSAGAETNTLAIPTFEGQRMILCAKAVGTGTRAVTAAAAINQATNTIMTFAQVRDAIGLVAMKVASALVWQVQFNDGVALS